MGRAIVAAGWRPEVAIVSDARRTQRTFEALALTKGPTLRTDGRLYDASPDAILEVIGETDAAVSCVLVVGHNPGIALAARRLAASGAAGDLERLRSSFPTACLAVVRSDAATWQGAAEAGGALEALLWQPSDDTGG